MEREQIEFYGKAKPIHMKNTLNEQEIEMETSI